ncbi:hypothetical protein [Enterobacter asburiae]|uniref:hypothetical protein n=1 Tax=Enterobacter asburiae TaxID=61645 RepID=UPI0034D28DC3
MLELKNSINWYLVKVNKAVSAIEAFKLHTDYDDLRFQYSVFLKSFFSLVDYMEDGKTVFRNKGFEMEREVKMNGVRGILF